MFQRPAFLLIVVISLIFPARSISQDQAGGLPPDPAVIVPDTLLQPGPVDIAWQPCTSIFIELMGKGFLSGNVDFRKKESQAMSVGFQPLEGLLPNVMYYYLGGKRHRVEIGGGLSAGVNRNFKLSVAMVHGVIGYRYQKKKGLLFRAGFTPLYVIFINSRDDNKLYPLGGLSLGYSF